MKKMIPVLIFSFTAVFQTAVQADLAFWAGFNANILMSQIGVANPSVLDPTLPSVALYSIQGSDRAIFNPEYLQEAVLGLAFNDAIASDSALNEQELATPYSSDLSSIVGCGCYFGGFGGIAGNGSSGAGGGDFSYYSASSEYSIGGMGFGGGGGSGGGGGGNPPTDPPNPPPPPQPPQPPPPSVHHPEPATWLTLAGALGAVIFWKRKRARSNS